MELPAADLDAQRVNAMPAMIHNAPRIVPPISRILILNTPLSRSSRAGPT
jgi:hypothetical protein